MPHHSLTCGVDQQRRIGQRGITLFPCNRVHRRTQRRSHLPRAFVSAIDQANLAHPFLKQTETNRPRTSACAHHDHRPGAGIPIRLCRPEIAHETKGIIVASGQAPIGQNGHATNGTNYPRGLADLVHGLHRGLLMGNRDVGPGKAQSRQRAQCGDDTVRGNRQGDINPGQLMFTQPIIVN